MKTKIISIFSFALLLSASALSVASAESLVGLSVNADLKANVELGDHGNATSAAAVSVHSNATSSEARDNREATNSEDRSRASSTKATSTKDRENEALSTGTTTDNENNQNGQVNADEHRSVVATFVQSLLNVANREGGIGAQVRAVAQSQNDAASTTAEAMAKVDDKGAVSKFFFGSDYKNLGVIRAELATTSANIAKLQTLLGQATNSTDKAELTAQIQVLQDEQAKLDAYVTANENTFSLFGWFTRIFQ